MPLRKTVDLNGGSEERLRGKCRLQRNQPMKPSSRFRELDVDWHELFEQMMGHGAQKRAFEETEVFCGLGVNWGPGCGPRVWYSDRDSRLWTSGSDAS
jgi:hypothetical protein